MLGHGNVFIKTQESENNQSKYKLLSLFQVKDTRVHSP